MTTGSSSATDYFETRIINAFIRGWQVTSASPYVALFTSTTASGYETGTPIEVTDAKYIRVTASGVGKYSSISENILSGPIIVPPPELQPLWIISGGSATNINEVTFPTPSVSMGPINGIGLTSGSSRWTTGSKIYLYSNPDDVLTVTGPSEYYTIPPSQMKIALMGAYSNYLANNLLDWTLNRKEISLPGTGIFMALFITMPDNYDENATEVPLTWYNPASDNYEANGYYRKHIGGTYNWSDPSTGSTIATASLISTFSWSAVGDWGPVEGFGIYQNPQDYLLFKARLDKPRIVIKGDTFAVGSLKIILD